MRGSELPGSLRLTTRSNRFFSAVTLFSTWFSSWSRTQGEVSSGPLVPESEDQEDQEDHEVHEDQEVQS